MTMVEEMEGSWRERSGKERLGERGEYGGREREDDEGERKNNQ